MQAFEYVQETWKNNPVKYFLDIQKLNIKLYNFNKVNNTNIDFSVFENIPKDISIDFEQLYIKYIDDKELQNCIEKKLNSEEIKFYDSNFCNLKTNKMTEVLKNNIKTYSDIKYNQKKTKRYHLKESTKKLVAGKQKYKCNNKSNSKIIENYDCPLWSKNDGSFDESGYEIDHIVEFSISKNNDINNLQALCHSCHSVKTKRFFSNYK